MRLKEVLLPSKVPQRGLDQAAQTPADAKVQTDVGEIDYRNHAMQSDENNTVCTDDGSIDVVRLVQFKRSDFDEDELNSFRSLECVVPMDSIGPLGGCFSRAARRGQC